MLKKKLTILLAAFATLVGSFVGVRSTKEAARADAETTATYNIVEFGVEGLGETAYEGDVIFKDDAYLVVDFTKGGITTRKTVYGKDYGTYNFCFNINGQDRATYTIKKGDNDILFGLDLYTEGVQIRDWTHILHVTGLEKPMGEDFVNPIQSVLPQYSLTIRSEHDGSKYTNAELDLRIRMIMTKEQYDAICVANGGTAPMFGIQLTVARTGMDSPTVRANCPNVVALDADYQPTTGTAAYYQYSLVIKQFSKLYNGSNFDFPIQANAYFALTETGYVCTSDIRSDMSILGMVRAYLADESLSDYKRLFEYVLNRFAYND